jgi:ribosome-binding factor A
MKQTPRTRKLSETIRELVASILQDEIADPRLDLVTVTGVDVTPDVSMATVYVIAHGGEDRYDEVLAGLASANGRIRSLVGRRLHTRVTPELRFAIDRSVDEGLRITEALKVVPPSLLAEERAGEDESVEAPFDPGEDDADADGDPSREEPGA